MKKIPWKSVSTGLLVLGAATAVFAATMKNYAPTTNDAVKIVQRSGSYVDANYQYAEDNTGPCTGAVPTISGFGTNSAVTHSTPACNLKITSGTAATNGTIILPVANTVVSGGLGWTCNAQDVTTVSATVSSLKETASTSNTAVLSVFDTNTAASNTVANDIIVADCLPY